MNPLVLVDFYKVHHFLMYPKGTTMVYSNLTARKSRLPGVNNIIFFGLQHFIKEYLQGAFDREFFALPWSQVQEEYTGFIPLANIDHIKALHTLGYLPIEIKSLPEGALVPIGVPVLTIKNTLPEFYWLTNYLETLMSTMLWQPITSATIAYEYKKLLTRNALETTGDASFVQWQGHDFSMRGMSSVESAILSGMGHLTSFTGTDTIPAIYQLEESYDAVGLIGASVPATEHSIQCLHYDFTTGEERQYFNHLLETYPGGIVSVVSDGFNLWDVITKTLPEFKERILARDGKLVIRPDSGDPVDILCGTDTPGSIDPSMPWNLKRTDYSQDPEQKGVIELLYEQFGGRVNKYGYKELDSHIGAIYGDSITLDRARQICERLRAKGFATTNVVLGIGSYTYQYNTRDTFGFAIKATYGEINGVGKEIYKDPITDDGTKKSKKGLLKVVQEGWTYKVIDQVTKEEEQKGELRTVFRDGILGVHTTLDEIRARININLDLESVRQIVYQEQ